MYPYVHARIFTCCSFGDCVFVSAVSVTGTFIRYFCTKLIDVSDHKNRQKLNMIFFNVGIQCVL